MTGRPTASATDRAAQVPIGGRIRFRWADASTTEHTTPEEEVSN